MHGRRVNRVSGSATSLPLCSGWRKIFLAVGILLIFIYVIGPLGLDTPMMKPIADFIEENDINANGYYYTDVAEFSVAEMHMKNSLEFGPKQLGPQSPQHSGSHRGLLPTSLYNQTDP